MTAPIVVSVPLEALGASGEIAKTFGTSPLEAAAGVFVAVAMLAFIAGAIIDAVYVEKERARA